MDYAVELQRIVWGADGQGNYGVAAEKIPDGFSVAVMQRSKGGKMKPVKGAGLSRPDLVKLRDRLNDLLRED